MQYACGYKVKEVGIQARQLPTTAHNVQGAFYVDDEDSDGDHPQDDGDVHENFVSNILKSFIGTVNSET